MKNKEIGDLFSEIEPGSHVCSIYRNREEELSLLFTFLENGIRRNYKCVYIFDDEDLEEIFRRLEDFDFNYEKYIDSGSLVFLDNADSYKTDRFDHRKVFDDFEKMRNQAFNEGYNGLWLAGQVTWFLSEVPKTDLFLEYESNFNDFIENQQMVALCFYKEGLFPAEILVDVIHTHPWVILNGELYENHYYVPIEIFAPRILGDVDKEHYESVKKDIEKRAGRTKKSHSGSEESIKELNSLLDTLEEIDKLKA